MGANKSQTIGHEYFLGEHLILCHGPVDAVTEMVYGGRTAWKGERYSSEMVRKFALIWEEQWTVDSISPVTSDEKIRVQAPELFGGRKKDGGLYGFCDVILGGATHGQNSYLASKLGQNVPAYRHLASIVLNKMSVASLSPTVKTIGVRVERYHGSGWNPAMAQVGRDANPAHIIYECLTNSEWGMGKTSNQLDEPAFLSVAERLHNDGLGISLSWQNAASVGEFIEIVKKHMDGFVYLDPATSLYTIKLSREDYVLEDTPVFNEGNVVELINFSRSGYSKNTPNEITVIYRDRYNNKQSVKYQNLANIQVQGRVINETVEMLGIREHDLAVRIAQREGESKTIPAALLTIKVPRSSGRTVMPGSVIRFAWARYGINNVPFRVVEVERGPVGASDITLYCVEDVFNLPDDSYLSTNTSLFSSPVSSMVDLAYQYVGEATYHDMINSFSDDEIEGFSDISTFISTLGAKDEGVVFGYEIAVSPDDTEYLSATTADVSFVIELESAVGPMDTVFSFTNINNFPNIFPDQLGYIDDEIVAIETRDDVALQLTVKRGVLDTVPAPHIENTIMFIDDRTKGIEPVERFLGEDVHIKLIASGSKDKLDIGSASTHFRTLTARYQRPYPPGNVRINGELFPEEIIGDIALTWAHRDRTQQTAGFNAWTEGSIGPELGVNYGVFITGENGLRQSFLSETGSAFNYTTEKDDFGLVHRQPNVTIKSIGLGIAADNTIFNGAQSWYRDLYDYPSDFVSSLQNVKSSLAGEDLLLDDFIGLALIDPSDGSYQTLETAGHAFKSVAFPFSVTPDTSFMSVTEKLFYLGNPGLFPDQYSQAQGYLVNASQDYANTLVSRSPKPVKDYRDTSSQIFFSNIQRNSLQFWAPNTNKIKAIPSHVVDILFINKDQFSSPIIYSENITKNYFADADTLTIPTEEKLNSHHPVVSASQTSNLNLLGENYCQVMGEIIYVQYLEGASQAGFEPVWNSAPYAVSLTQVLDSHIDMETAAVVSTKRLHIDGATNISEIDTRHDVFARAARFNASDTEGIEITQSGEVTIFDSSDGETISSFTIAEHVVSFETDYALEHLYAVVVISAGFLTGELRKYARDGQVLASITLPFDVAPSSSALSGTGGWDYNDFSYVFIGDQKVYVKQAVDGNVDNVWSIDKDLTAWKDTERDDDLSEFFGRPDTTLHFGSSPFRHLDEVGGDVIFSPAGSPRRNGEVTVSINSSRDDLESHQSVTHTTKRHGWGLNWGGKWG
ncbi:MAG: hypothetical protein K6L81_02000 [Agarilytica sp.]